MYARTQVKGRYAHVPRQSDGVEGERTLGLDGPGGTDVVEDEGVGLWCGLEPLESVPWFKSKRWSRHRREVEKVQELTGHAIGEHATL